MPRRRLLQRLSGFIPLSAAALVTALAFGVGSLAPANAATAQLAFSPTSSSVTVGGSVAVDITVANVSNLGGYDIYVQFNPAVVHVTSLTDAGFVTGGGNIVVCNTATIDNSAGTATNSCATISPFGTPTPGISTVSPTPLMHASFMGVALGTSPLTLTGSTLEDPNGATIAATLGAGSITVAASVGGAAELTGTGAPPPQTKVADPSRPPYLPAAFAIGLLGVVAGAIYAMRRRRRAS